MYANVSLFYAFLWFKHSISCDGDVLSQKVYSSHGVPEMDSSQTKLQATIFMQIFFSLSDSSVS